MKSRSPAPAPTREQAQMVAEHLAAIFGKLASVSDGETARRYRAVAEDCRKAIVSYDWFSDFTFAEAGRSPAPTPIDVAALAELSAQLIEICERWPQPPTSVTSHAGDLLAFALRALDVLKARVARGRSPAEVPPNWRENRDVQKAFHDYAGGEPMCAETTWRRRAERLIDAVWRSAQQ